MFQITLPGGKELWWKTGSLGKWKIRAEMKPSSSGIWTKRIEPNWTASLYEKNIKLRVLWFASGHTTYRWSPRNFPLGTHSGSFSREAFSPALLTSVTALLLTSIFWFTFQLWLFHFSLPCAPQLHHIFRRQPQGWRRSKPFHSINICRVPTMY